jgi:hypothetical protein
MPANRHLRYVTSSRIETLRSVILLIGATFDTFQTSRCFGTGLAMIKVKRGVDLSEERDSILGGAGSNWHKPIGSYGSARRRAGAFLYND